MALFNTDFYGIWGTKALNGDRKLCLNFGSGYLGREKTILGRGRRRNPREIPRPRCVYSLPYDHVLLHSPIYNEDGMKPAVDRNQYSMH